MKAKWVLHLNLNVDEGFVDDSQSSLPRVHVVGGDAFASEEIHHVTTEFLIERNNEVVKYIFKNSKKYDAIMIE